MTKIFLQNKGGFAPLQGGLASPTDRRKAKKKWIFIFAVFALLGATNGEARNFTVKIVVGATSPFFKLAKLTSEKKDNFLSLFRDKRFLNEELNFLKEKNIELENKKILLESAGKENEELRAMLFRSDKKNYILGFVISRPPQSPYDVIVIDAGLDNGAKQGMKAIAYSNVLIGHVAEVFSGSSKVKLISYPGEETNLIIETENAKISAIGLGLGGGNIEVKIPSSVKVNSDDKITTEGSFRYLLGLADKIETDPLNPFQKIIFRIPVNLNELQKIGIEK